MVAPKKKAKPPTKSERALARLVEQGDERYSQQGRELYAINQLIDLLKGLADMPNKFEEIIDAVQRTETNVENVKAAVAKFGEEIDALKAHVEELIAAQGTEGLTLEQAQEVVDRLNAADTGLDSALPENPVIDNTLPE